MGMFDWIVISCPHCGGLVNFQSKGGPCTLETYDEINAPASVAEDLNGKVEKCEYCGAEVQSIAKTMCVITSRIINTKRRTDYGQRTEFFSRSRGIEDKDFFL